MKQKEWQSQVSETDLGWALLWPFPQGFRWSRSKTTDQSGPGRIKKRTNLIWFVHQSDLSHLLQFGWFRSRFPSSSSGRKVLVLYRSTDLVLYFNISLKCCFIQRLWPMSSITSQALGPLPARPVIQPCYSSWRDVSSSTKEGLPIFSDGFI